MHDDFVSMLHRIHRDVQMKHKMDSEFSRIWNYQIGTNSDVHHRYHSELQRKGISMQHTLGMDDLVKVHSNIFGKMSRRQPFGVYALLSKMSFGLPQNVAVIFGEEQDDYVCVVMATKDIPKGSHIATDYLFDWFSFPRNPVLRFQKYWKRLKIGDAHLKTFGFDEHNRWMKVLRDLNAENTSKHQKYQIAESALYPNGVIGKESGSRMEVVSDARSEFAKEIKEFVDSRRLFDALRGDLRCTVSKHDGGLENILCELPWWTGKQFQKAVEVWQQEDVLLAYDFFHA